MLRFRIGLVAKHKKYNYKCVINGWDDHCAAPQVCLKGTLLHNLTWIHGPNIYKDNKP